MTSPYYQDDLVTLFHGDCQEVCEWLAADVLVTDPPYGMGYRSRAKSVASATIIGDRSTEARDAAIEAWGDVKPALVFGRWSITPPKGERQRIIWSKVNTPGMGDLRIPWGPAHEDIHLLGQGWDVAATGHKRVGSVIATSGARGGAYGEENFYGHPTPKPVALLESLISRCPTGMIADPFAGVGATLIAARNLGRRSIGVEIEERYCAAIAMRLAQGVLDFGFGD